MHGPGSLRSRPVFSYLANCRLRRLLFTIRRLELLYHFAIDQSAWPAKALLSAQLECGAAGCLSLGPVTLSTVNANFAAEAEKTTNPQNNLLLWKLICLFCLPIQFFLSSSSLWPSIIPSLFTPGLKSTNPTRHRPNPTHRTAFTDSTLCLMKMKLLLFCGNFRWQI